MLEIGALIFSGLFFLVSMGALIVMVKEFSHMKTAAILMESAFKDHKEVIDGVQSFVQHGLEGAEAQYKTVMEQADVTMQYYQKVINENHKLIEDINKLKERQKKPMAPDVTLN
jgi:hypothetical protein